MREAMGNKIEPHDSYANSLFRWRNSLFALRRFPVPAASRIGAQHVGSTTQIDAKPDRRRPDFEKFPDHFPVFREAVIARGPLPARRNARRARRGTQRSD